MYAQEEGYPVIIEDYITLRFNQTHGGRNVELSYIYRDGKHRLKAGLNIHLDRKVKDNQGHVFKDRFMSNKPLEHFGVNLGYRHPILPIKHSDIQLSVFFNVEIFVVGLRDDKYPVFLGRDEERNLLFYVESYYTDKATAHIDYILGLSLSIKAYENIYLNMTGGYGVLMSFTGSDRGMSEIGITDIEVSSQRWSIGINYRLRKKTVQRLYYE